MKASRLAPAGERKSLCAWCQLHFLCTVICELHCPDKLSNVTVAAPKNTQKKLPENLPNSEFPSGYSSVHYTAVKTSALRVWPAGGGHQYLWEGGHHLADVSNVPEQDEVQLVI